MSTYHKYPSFGIVIPTPRRGIRNEIPFREFNELDAATLAIALCENLNKLQKSLRKLNTPIWLPRWSAKRCGTKPTRCRSRASISDTVKILRAKGKSHFPRM